MTETVVSRDTIAAAIAVKRAMQKRMPAHWVERRAQVGDEIDRLVLEWLASEL